jgi:hypothetical protein
MRGRAHNGERWAPKCLRRVVTVIYVIVAMFVVGLGTLAVIAVLSLFRAADVARDARKIVSHHAERIREEESD